VSFPQNSPLVLCQYPSASRLDDFGNGIELDDRECERLKIVPVLLQRQSWQRRQSLPHEPPAIDLHSQQIASFRENVPAGEFEQHHPRVEFVLRPALGVVGRVEADPESFAESFSQVDAVHEDSASVLCAGGLCCVPDVDLKPPNMTLM
jgi:hypothetical protein